MGNDFFRQAICRLPPEWASSVEESATEFHSTALQKRKTEGSQKIPHLEQTASKFDADEVMNANDDKKHRKKDVLIRCLGSQPLELV
jgi:hypothetical protein